MDVLIWEQEMLINSDITNHNYTRMNETIQYDQRSLKQKTETEEPQRPKAFLFPNPILQSTACMKMRPRQKPLNNPIQKVKK